MSKPKAGAMGKVSVCIQNGSIREREKGNKYKCDSPMALKTFTANGLDEEERAHIFCHGPDRLE